MRRRPVPALGWLVAGGLIVGTVIGVGAGLLLDDRSSSDADDPPPSFVLDPDAIEPVESAAAAEDFVEAWERSRRGTFVVVSTFTRTTTDGRELEARSVVVQRPPDRLAAQGGSVTGRIGGERIVCDPTPDDQVRCQRTPAVGDAESEVVAEVEQLRGYVSGPAPLYRVAADGPCFRLRLARALAAPPYGTRAHFCFDPATGAPSRTEVERREGTDVVVADEIRPSVTDADLADVLADVDPAG